MRIVECTACHLAWVNPRPRADLVASLYDRSYFGGESHSVGIGYQEYGAAAREARERHAHAEARLALIDSYHSLAGAALLEIGCAMGDFCGFAQQHGCRTLGVDVSPEVIEIAQGRHPTLSFRACTAEELANEDTAFDIVCAFEVIEHVLSPLDFLRAVRRLTRPNGIVMLSTPNYGLVGDLGAERWLGFRTSFEHLYFLSPASIAATAADAGLELVDWYSSGNGEWVDPESSAGKRRPFRHLLEKLHLLDTARTLKLLVTRHPTAEYRRQAPGHTLLAVLRRVDGPAESPSTDRPQT